MDEIEQADKNFSKNTEKEQISDSKNKSSQLLLSAQLIVSMIFLTTMFTLKFVNIEQFKFAREWYLKNINNSLLCEGNMQSCKETLNSRLPIVKDVAAQDNATVSRYKSAIEPLPVTVSTLVTKPLDDGVITSKFGKRIDPLTGEEKVHYGLDLCAPKGTAIYAILPGVVEKAEKSPSFGNFVTLNHGNNIKSVYAHCEAINVKNGEQVARGQNIATIGNTGYYSSGTHLHVELIIDGQKYDPEPFFEARLV